MIEPPLLFTRDNGIARLTLNRPNVGNAIDLPLARALMEASIACDGDDSIRVVLLTGIGRLFCSGGDIQGFYASGDRLPALLTELTAYLHSAVARFSRMGKPMLTAINGPAAGAGLSLAMLGDIAIAAPAAHFTVAYTALGMSPDGGASWLLPRLIGLRRAQELALLNRRVSAAEAVVMGLITRVAEEGALAAETEAAATQLCAAATQALGRTRNLLLQSYGRSLEEQLELEARSISASGRGTEGKEGVDAFVARRKPDFRGVG